MDVALVRCRDYSDEETERAFGRALSLLGGIDKFVSPGMRVVVKPNLVLRKRPEECVTTHPAIVKQVVSALMAAGADVTIGDSPGGVYNTAWLHGVYEGTGMAKVARETGANLNYDTAQEEVSFPDGAAVKRITVAGFILKADAVVSVAKLKTHCMMSLSGAVKNLFGVVPGTAKAEYHYRLPEVPQFADMLVDLAEFVKPRLSIIDAVWGMEGEGPTAGKPRSIGALIASACPHSADVMGATLAGMNAPDIPTIRAAIGRGIIPARPEDINILGDDAASLAVPDFVPAPVKSLALLERYLPEFIHRYARRKLTPRPTPDEAKCVGCGICEKNCPPRAITMASSRPVIDHGLCIRCFCCHELCPSSAMKIKRPLLFRLIK